MDIVPLGPGFCAELRCVTLADVGSDDAVGLWRKGDVVMWDNRATMHRGRPWSAHEARLMIRTAISATEPDGVDTMRPPSSQAAE